MSLLKEISITELSNLRIGHTSDHDAKTGVTVLYFPNGAKAGCDISGGGPASRETPLTSPVTADNPINAIVLSGGSAYGLAAADGVMNYLESQNIGYNTGSSISLILAREKAPENPPSPPSTSSRMVLFTCSFISSTDLYPASISTPAVL